jgi:hypothetical protein
MATILRHWFCHGVEQRPKQVQKVAAYGQSLGNVIAVYKSLGNGRKQCSLFLRYIRKKDPGTAKSALLEEPVS